MEKICIIGGGASALMCACWVRKDADVIILESGDRIGKKILATGNGRCNLINANMNSCSYNMPIDNYMDRFNSYDMIRFFNKIGLEIYFDEEGRGYPISNTATSVLAVLKNHIETKKNIKIETGNTVTAIKKQKNGYLVEINGKKELFFNKVVVASGNYTKLDMMDELNIKYVPFKPSLCSLRTEKHKNLAGVRVSGVLVSCKTNGINFSETGEVLFKDDGISGIVVFNLSAHMARKNNYNNKITIDLLPNKTASEVLNLLNKRRDDLGEYKVEEFLTGLFHKQINYELLKRCGLNMNVYSYCLSNNDINLLVKNIKALELNTCGYFDNNQVMSGGVELSELNENLESRDNKGLYFIGEVVNVDGVCGGFNLGWAWASGKIVGEKL